MTATYLTIPCEQLPFMSTALQQVLTHFDCYRNPWTNTREYTIPLGVAPVLQSRYPETAGHRLRYPLDIEHPSLGQHRLIIDISTGQIL